MRILVFGASGGTGRQVVAQALARGMAVTAFVRDPAKLPDAHATLRVVTGDVADAAAVAAALAGQEVVLSTLGVSIPLRHDEAVINGIGHIVSAMQAGAARRFIYLSAILVGDSRHASGFLARHIGPIPLRHELADHAIKEDIIRASHLDWTIVRAPKMTNRRQTDTYRAGVDIVARSIFPTLSRADVAGFMLRQVIDTAFVRKVARLLP